MVHLGEVIDIQSSQEPASPPHHAQSRLAYTKSRNKGKERATPNRLGLTQASRAIELTDSDSDPSPTTSPLHSRPLSSKSTNFIQDLNPCTLKSTKFLDNIPTPSSSAVASGSGTRVLGPIQRRNPTLPYPPTRNKNFRPPFQLQPISHL